MRMIQAKDLMPGDVIFGPGVAFEGCRAEQSTVEFIDRHAGEDALIIRLQSDQRSRSVPIRKDTYVILLSRDLPGVYVNIAHYLARVDNLIGTVASDLRAVHQRAEWGNVLHMARDLKRLREVLNELEWGDLEATNDHLHPFNDPFDRSLAHQSVDAGFGDR